MFPTPKETLHNFYRAFYEENNKTVALLPTYRLVKDGKSSQWICTYHIHWPQEIKFHSKDTTKKEASYKAALAVLNWLKNNEKISEKGALILYNKEEVTQLTKKTIPSIILSRKTMQNINDLMELYENDLSPIINKYKTELCTEKSDKEDETLDTDQNNNESNQRKLFLGMHNYLSKEKVDLPISKYK